MLPLIIAASSSYPQIMEDAYVKGILPIIINDLLENHNKADPYFFFEALHSLKDVPGISEFTIRALDSSKNTSFGIGYYKQFKDIVPDPDKYLKNAVDFELRQYPELILHLYPSYESSPLASEIVDRTCQKLLRKKDYRSLTHFFFSNPELKTEKLSAVRQKTYEKIVTSHPIYFLTYGSAFKDLPGYDENVTRVTMILNLNQAEHNDSELTFADPALKELFKCKRDWLPELNDRQFANDAAAVCRNLYFQNKEFSESTFKLEYKNLLELREKYKDVSIFKDRNIVMASHVEKRADGKFRFGTPLLSASLEIAARKNEKEFKHIEGRDYEHLIKIKEDTLNALEEAPEPLTFIFDGHGGPDALYFTDGQILKLEKSESNGEIVTTRKTIKITYQELAASIAKRFIEYGENIRNDIYIFSGCYNHDFIRNLYGELHKLGVDLPISFGPSEYGQYAYSNLSNPFGADFYTDLLKLHEEDPTGATLKDIWEYKGEKLISNPSLYIPQNNVPMQLGAIEKPLFRGA
jgi:hypothetical protein